MLAHYLMHYLMYFLTSIHSVIVAISMRRTSVQSTPVAVKVDILYCNCGKKSDDIGIDSLQCAVGSAEFAIIE